MLCAAQNSSMSAISTGNLREVLFVGQDQFIAATLSGLESSSEAATFTASIAVTAFQLASKDWLADSVHHHLKLTTEKLGRTAHRW
jgi:hypothetical protein